MQETPEEYFEINWEPNFNPLYGVPIVIPKNTLLWRSYDTNYPAIGSRFAYYSSIKIAEGYLNKTRGDRELGCFMTTKPLRVLDVRFLKNLLTRLIHTNSEVHASLFAPLVLSFGLCSLGHQIRLAKLRYEAGILEDNIKQLEKYYKPNALIEQPGFRIAETTNDVYTMGFLQELFEDSYDGFISPRMYSPFHIEKADARISPELILFNPEKSKLKRISDKPMTTSIITISELIRKYHSHVILEMSKSTKPKDIKLEYYMCGGGSDGDNKHPLDIADDKLNKKDKQLTRIYNNARRAGRDLRKRMNIYEPIPPNPTSKVNAFMSYFIEDRAEIGL